MRIDADLAVELASQYYYLDETGLSTYFTPKTVENNSGVRHMEEKQWRPEDLYWLLLKLDITKNKLFIIRLLRRGEIIPLLSFLDKSQLLFAMQFFPRSKLIQFMHMLPKDMLLKMLLWVMPLRTFLSLFKNKILFHILSSKRLQVKEIVQGFAFLPLEQLQQLMKTMTGKDVHKLKKGELLAMFRELKKGTLMQGIKKMPKKFFLEFIYQLTRKDPKLLMMIPRGEIMNVMMKMPKPNLIEMMEMLPKQMLTQFLTQLPDKMLALAASQIDDGQFMHFLLNSQPDLIASLAMEAAA